MTDRPVTAPPGTIGKTRHGSRLTRSAPPRPPLSGWPRGAGGVGGADPGGAGRDHGLAGGLIVLLTAVPMLIIANAYRKLNLWNANCGASFEWVGRSINPSLGFMAGWLMIAGNVVGTAAVSSCSGRRCWPSSAPARRRGGLTSRSPPRWSW